MGIGVVMRSAFLGSSRRRHRDTSVHPRSGHAIPRHVNVPSNHGSDHVGANCSRFTTGRGNPEPISRHPVPSPVSLHRRALRRANGRSWLDVGGRLIDSENLQFDCATLRRTRPKPSTIHGFSADCPPDHDRVFHRLRECVVRNPRRERRHNDFVITPCSPVHASPSVSFASRFACNFRRNACRSLNACSCSSGLGGGSFLRTQDRTKRPRSIRISRSRSWTVP